MYVCMYLLMYMYLCASSVYLYKQEYDITEYPERLLTHSFTQYTQKKTLQSPNFPFLYAR